MREVYSGLSAEELAAEHERQALIRAAPELWAGMLNNLTGTVDQLVVSISHRTGRAADDIAVLALAGAVVGTGIAVWMRSPADAVDDYVELFDAAMARLEPACPCDAATACSKAMAPASTSPAVSAAASCIAGMA
jgi:MftR C-terminal domain